MEKSCNATRGFSLVEMSIALVIIGLLTSAIFAGVKLVTYAKIRALNAEKDARQSEIYGFFSKYNEYPGDFSEATIYWDLPSVTSGDGDGAISYKNDSADLEGYNAWQQLSLAGMAENDFAGGGDPVSTTVPGTHIPASVFGGGFFLDNDFAGHSGFNTLILATPTEISGDSLVVNSLLLPKDARDVDKKYDDGNPSQGVLHVVEGDDVSAGDCVDDNGTSGTTSDDSYNLTNESRSCVVAYKIMSQ